MLFNQKYDNAVMPALAGINYISVGMRYLMDDETDLFKSIHYSSINVEELESTYFPRLTEKKHRWAMAAAFAPTLYEYLKNKIYTDDDDDTDND